MYQICQKQIHKKTFQVHTKFTEAPKKLSKNSSTETVPEQRP